MRVLVVGTMPTETERAAERLGDAGHEVVRCHLSGRAPFPCAGLDAGGRCPLDEAPVDVAVTAHARPWARPSPFEDGAICAIRRFVPLVVAGSPVHPFRRWVVREVEADDDIVAACEEAADAPLPDHTEAATSAARGVLDGRGVDAAEVAATVQRQRGRLRALITLPVRDRELDARVTIAVHAALRELDAYAEGIDISLSPDSL